MKGAKRKGKRPIKISQELFATKHGWPLRRMAGIEDYIIPGLTTEEAAELYKQTGDEKYAQHVFFSNLGYFLNTIVAVMSMFGHTFHYTKAHDYICYAYLAVQYGLKRYERGRGASVLSFVAMAVVLRLCSAVRHEEVRWWEERAIEIQEEHEGEEFNADVEAYKRASEAEYKAMMDSLDARDVLQSLFERFKDKLAPLGINSVDDMYLLYGNTGNLSNEHRKLLYGIRKEMREYLRTKYKDYLSE